MTVWEGIFGGLGAVLAALAVLVYQSWKRRQWRKVTDKLRAMHRRDPFRPFTGTNLNAGCDISATITVAGVHADSRCTPAREYWQYMGRRTWGHRLPDGTRERDYYLWIHKDAEGNTSFHRVNADKFWSKS